eukprot:9659613-Heterocapsa_arctica.AAC.1
MDHAPVSMGFVFRDWHNPNEQRDEWDRQVLKHMVKDPNAAAAFVDAVQAWAESDSVQDAWQRA